MRILVTGAAGFIGSSLCKDFEKTGHEVIACDNFSYGTYKTLLDFKGEILAKDIAELSESDLAGVDVVFHQAAISDPTVNDETKILATNLTSSIRLMKMCVGKVIPFIYASSAAVYGNTKLPNKEFEAEKPHNAYAFSKLKLDQAAKKLMGKSQIMGLRYFNVYGPGERYKGKPASMVRHFAVDILNGNNPIIYGDGKQKRDFVYIKDVVNANLLALKSGKSGIINIGSGKATDFNELVQLIAKIAGKRVKPVYKDNPYSEGYQYATEADIHLAKSTIEYKPEWFIDKGVAEYIKYLE